MYFDPGTGSLIVQMLLAVIAGIASFFVVFKNNLRSFFNKSGNKHEERKK